MTESAEQISFAKWLNGQGVLWNHCPNEGKRSFWVGKLLRSMGLKRGFPDIAIYARSPSDASTPRGWAVELKLPGNTPTDDQRKWLTDLQRAGWHVTVAYSAQEAIDWCKREWGLS